MLYQQHTEACITSSPGLFEAMQEFFSRWRGACVQCGAVGYVNLSGMNLPCSACMGATDCNGPYCPRCHSKSIYPGTQTPGVPDSGFWPTGQPCKNCGWKNAKDGAPIIDCKCPMVVTVKDAVYPLSAAEVKAVKATKEERLESLRNAGS